MKGRHVSVNRPVHPAVRFLNEEARRQGLARNLLAERAGVAENAPSTWCLGIHEPRVSMLDTCLNALGFRLAVVPLEAPNVG